MSFDQFIVVLLAVCGLALAVISLANVLGSSIYDVRDARRRHQRIVHPHARIYRQRPMVTVLVVAHDDETIIEACLDSLRRASYRKLQVIVVDNASADSTSKIVKRYRVTHPWFNLRLVTKRKAEPWASGARKAYKAHGSGEMVMTLNADSQVDKHAIVNAVTHINECPELRVLSSRLKPADATTVSGLAHKYLNLMAQQSDKASNVFRVRRTVSANGAFFRGSAFLEESKLMSKSRPEGSPRATELSVQLAMYCHDMIVHQPSATSYYRTYKQLTRPKRSAAFLRNQLATSSSLPGQSRVLTWFAKLLSVSTNLTILLVPFLSSYFIYIALKLHEPLFLIMSLVALSLVILFAIWDDEGLGFRQRLAYTLGIPVTYSIFFALAWLRLGALLINSLRPSLVTHV